MSETKKQAVVPFSRSVVALLAAALCVLANACVNTDQNASAPTATSQPWPTSTPDVSYEQALNSIPLMGTAERPLFWRIGDNLDQVYPVQTVHHLVALISHIAGSAEPQTPYALLPLLETGTVAHLIRRYLSDWYRVPPPVEYDPGYAGPRWIWVVDAALKPDRADDECLPILIHRGECASIDRRNADAAVTLCFDNGYWLPTDGRPRPTPPVADRVEIRTYVVMHLPIGNGERRWLVTRTQAGTSVAEERYRQPCEEWAAGNRPESEE